MPSANTKAWISVLLASSAIPVGLCAPMDAGSDRKPPAPALLDVDVDILDGILARGLPAPPPPALLDVDVDVLDGILARGLPSPAPPALLDADVDILDGILARGLPAPHPPALLDVDVDVLDGILARGPHSPAPPALLDADIEILDGILARDLPPPPPALPLPAPLGPNVGVPPAIAKRDAAATDAQLAKRYLIGSPYQKRTIQVALKKAVHGLAAGTTWLWEISYKYTSTNGGKDGKVTGNLVKGDGTFAFGNYHNDNSFVSHVEGIVSATFDAVVARTNEKIQLTLSWAEDFTSSGATLEDHGRTSAFTYFTAGGRQERLSQEFFEYAIKQS